MVSPRPQFFHLLSPAFICRYFVMGRHFGYVWVDRYVPLFYSLRRSLSDGAIEPGSLLPPHVRCPKGSARPTRLCYTRDDISLDHEEGFLLGQ